MKDAYDQKLMNELSLLNLIDGFVDFYKKYSEENNLIYRSDFFSLLKSFEELLTAENRMGADEKLIISHVIEIAESTSYEKSSSKLGIINHTLRSKEDFILKFLVDFENAKSGELRI